MTLQRKALKLALVIAELRQAHAGHTNEGPSTFSDAADLLEALTQPEQSENDDDLILVPRILIGAACCAIDKKRDAPETLEKLRGYSMGAQPVQEPVAWVKYARKKPEVKALSWQEYPTASEIAQGFVSEPLYRNPPKREWVGLTDEWVTSAGAVWVRDGNDLYAFAQAIEAKLKELNHKKTN